MTNIFLTSKQHIAPTNNSKSKSKPHKYQLINTFACLFELLTFIPRISILVISQPQREVSAVTPGCQDNNSGTNGPQLVHKNNVLAVFQCANRHCLHFLWFYWCSGKVFFFYNCRRCSLQIQRLQIACLTRGLNKIPTTKFIIKKKEFCRMVFATSTTIHFLLCTWIVKASVKSPG